MEVIIRGDPKEIAALVFDVQERLRDEIRLLDEAEIAKKLQEAIETRKINVISV